MTTITEEKKTYPIGGYAPGNYMNNCGSCGDEFMGDKRALECERCGRHSESTRKYVIQVLQFISDKHELKLTGEDLLDEYLKDVFKQFVESDYYKQAMKGI